jgi:membrane protein DedA with SNARE-associated domain
MIIEALRTSNWVLRVSVAVFMVATVLTVVFGLRTYGSLLLLRSAYEAGAPRTSSVRPWMTLTYVATAYRIPSGNLIEHLGVSPGTDSDKSIKALADQAGVSAYVYTQRVQRAIAAAVPDVRSNGAVETSGWLGKIAEDALTALLVYGYPALGLTLLLGAIGFPLPDGIATTLAGSLVAQGRMNWVWTGSITVVASVLGDAIGYSLGRLLNREILDRHGYWIGYTSARRAHVQSLFDEWGSLTVLLTRTFMSYLSSVASFLAGISHFRLSKFLIIALVGRMLWTTAYLGLGYGIGSDWEAAAGFLTNLSALLFSAMLLAGAGTVGWRKRVTPQSVP